MQKRSSFITFITALIPGVGYMYLGLVKKGIQVLLLFLLIEPLFRLLGINFLTYIIRVPLWFYTFFDTFSVARQLDLGNQVPDTDFIFNKYTNDGEQKFIDSSKIGKGISLVIGAFLVFLGGYAIVHNIFKGNELYELITSFVSSLFIPVLLVFAGLFMLFKNRKYK